MTTSTAALAANSASITPTTPKAVSVRLATRNTTLRPMADLVAPSVEIHGVDDRTINGKDLMRGRNGAVDDDWANDGEGRMTPVPTVDSSRSVSGSSHPSDQSQSSPNSTSISSVSSQSQVAASTSAKPTFNTLPVVPARMGLGNIQGEEQLKSALQGNKDRFFLIVLSKEIEAFIRSVITGNAPSAALEVPIATPSTSLLAGASFKMGSVASSKFQRMLVYKSAEWYGLKAISTGDGTMYIGVMGSLPEESAKLKLSELVPTPNEPSQKFQLMRRTQNNGDAVARNGTPGDEASDATRQTYEERTAAYAAARERILGSSGAEGDISEDLAAIVEEEVRGRARRQDAEEPDPIPRHPLGATLPTSYEHVYPSLYHPPVEETQPAPPPQMDTSAQGYNYLTGQTYPLYPEPNYQSPDPYAAPGPSYQMPYPPQSYGAPMPYMAPPNVAAWQQQSANSMAPPMGMAPMPRSPMMAPPMMQHHQGWDYVHQMHSPIGLGNQNRQMPMIPQGMQYQQYAPYPPNAMYGQLHQPVPSRPNPQHHSSASSSISSRSYQDYSRPHSRGSTTSTRSATSSVRMGAMYPAGAGAGPSHRQAGIRGQGLNGMTSLGLRSERTSHRGHSPSSATTTSSRSSRKTNTNSIVLTQPSQHPLPQRPDWAANNIPYRPAPILEPEHSPDTAEFPPLRQVVHAEPMQFERARTKTVSAPNQSVWNGSAGKVIANGGAVPGSPSSAKAVPAPSTAKPITVIPASHVAAASLPEGDAKRPAPIRLPATLDTAVAKPISRPQSAARSATPAATSAEDIEAKLAAVSLNVGISIGPPPSAKSANGATPSYAKIVRRD